jgi:Tol biopolymer transport system component
MKADGSDSKPAFTGFAGFPQWSPDGTRFSYLVEDSLFQSDPEPAQVRTAQLWVAAADGSNPRQIATIKYPQLAYGNAPLMDFLPYTYVFWSPDSTSLAYLNYVNHDETTQRSVDFEIRGVSTNGGDSYLIASTTLAWDDWTYRSRPLAWSPDGNQIAYTSFSRSKHGLYVVSAQGGETRQLTSSLFASYPAWTNDGKSILFVESPILSHMRMNGTKSWLSLTPGTLRLVSVESGDATDLSKSQVIEPVLSPDGSQVAYYVNGTGVVVLNLSDKVEMIVSPACAYMGNLYSINWSPDGRYLAFQSGTPFSNGCTFDDSYGWRVFNLQGAEIVRIPATWGGYSFSPDSTRFIAPSGGSGQLMLANLLDGSKSDTGIAQAYGPVWQP